MTLSCPESNTTTAEPMISVVVPSVSGLPAISECLEALLRQQGNVSYEILVVDRCHGKTRAALQERFSQPQVRLIPADDRTSIPQLRAVGISRARGRWIAILEDHCNVTSQWCEAVWRSCSAGHLVIGGAVENGSDRRTVDWAMFFCEYARFMLPLQRGPVPDITGNNSVYDRDLLLKVQGQVENEEWESFLHRRLRIDGIGFHCEPDQVVYHKKELCAREFVVQRYYYSRSYANMRLNGAGRGKRLLYAAATLFLPGLLLARITKTVVQKGRHRKEFLRSLPLIVAYVSVWAWGEGVGALFGPGTSLEHVE